MMSPSNVAAFDKTIEKTNVWLGELQAVLTWDDRERAYHALRAVLHALRDRLPPHEAVDLGAQLPMLVRGFYYDGWHPADKPLKYRDKRPFLRPPGTLGTTRPLSARIGRVSRAPSARRHARREALSRAQRTALAAVVVRPQTPRTASPPQGRSRPRRAIRPRARA
jgi:uncharacterized protein (DUF2267 family)